MTAQLTLGVIGHVDHGKTALVRALTGIETDRLKEEQERGLSIVLGFSYLQTPNGMIDLIDVPGHEDFVRTMISGATGIDGVLLVVAANEGVMPQTREHCDIASLLGIERGLIVITKADTVSPDELGAAIEDVRAYVSGGFLENAPVVPTSATTGEGMDALRGALAGLASVPVSRVSADTFYLPIDRVFAMHGFGAVVTGTLRMGTLRANAAVEILPGGESATVRGLQVHNQAVEEARAGQRVAVNLRSLKREALRRGDVLATPGLIEPTGRLDVELQLLDSQKEPLRNGTAVRVLLGTTEVVAKVRLLDQPELSPGCSGLVQLRCRADVATQASERFIIRSLSPVRTMGGGRILDAAAPPRHRRFDEAVTSRLRSAVAGDAGEIVKASLAAAGALGIDGQALRTQLGLSEDEMGAAVVAAGGLAVGGDRFVDRGSHSHLKSKILAEVEQFHAANPRQQGIAAASIKSRLASDVDDAVFRHAADELQAKGALANDNGVLSRVGYDPLESLPPNERKIAAQLEAVFLSGGLTPPPLDTVLRGDRGKRDLYRLLSDTGRLVRLKTYDRNSNLVLHKETLDDVRRRLQAQYPYPKEFAVSEVRDLLSATRKYIVPLMEHLDATGVTIRSGNVRRLRQRVVE